MQPLVAVSLGIAVAAPLIARGVGSVLARARWVEAGRAREVMPGAPAALQSTDPVAAKRFDADVARIMDPLRARILDRAAGGWSAERVASELSVPFEIARAALERLRAIAACRLRVTRDGRLLHDFDEASLRAATSTRRRSTFARVLLFPVALVANVGAVWPVVLSFIGPALALAGLRDDDAYLTAVGVLIMVPLAFAAVLVGGVVLGGLLTPLSSTPKLGNALPKDPEKKDEKAQAAPAVEKTTPKKDARTENRRERRRRAAEEKRRAMGQPVEARAPAAKEGSWQSRITSTDTFGVEGIVGTLLLVAGVVGVPLLIVVLLAKAFAVSTGTVLLWGCIVAVVVLFIVLAIATEDIEGAFKLTPFVVVGLLIAVALFSLVGAGMWLIGLFTSMFQDRAPTVSPQRWIATKGAGDDFGALVPTNDLVLRTHVALHRALARDRPVDPELAVRVQGLAARRGGKLGAVELSLEEALDPNAALSIGARVSAHAGGEIDVTEEGEIVFTFPNATDTPVEPAGRECFADEDGKLSLPIGIPVNIPGLTLADVEGAERLAAGTLLLFGCALASHAGLVTRMLPAATWAPPSWTPLATALLFFATCVLAAMLRYAARAEARAGFFRDVRRVTYARLARVFEERGTTFDARAFAGEVHGATLELWPALEIDAVIREVEGVCDELGLEPTDRSVYALGSLGDRIASVETWRGRGVSRANPSDDSDEIVWDSGAISSSASVTTR